jgi:hypothetical protein
MKPLLLVLIVGMALLSTGCADDRDPVRVDEPGVVSFSIELESSEFDVGEALRVSVTIENSGSEPVVFSFANGLQYSWAFASESGARYFYSRIYEQDTPQFEVPANGTYSRRMYIPTRSAGLNTEHDNWPFPDEVLPVGQYTLEMRINNDRGQVPSVATADFWVVE